MSGYNITNNPRNFAEKPIYAKTAPNFEANNIALNVLDINQGWEIKPILNQLNISYNGQSVFNIPASVQQRTGTVLSFLLNGKLVQVKDPDADITLLQYLRQYTPYTATKKGCTQGGCGVCTVMLSYIDQQNVKKNVSINSCLVRLVEIANLAITTNEGLGNTMNLHPIQQHFLNIGAFQCSYCTSGFIMNIYSSFQNTNGQSNDGQTPLWAETEKNLDGNLCRCTGYRPIIEAYKTLMVQGPTPSGPYAQDPVQNLALWNKWKAPVGFNADTIRLPVYNPINDTKNCTSYAALPVVQADPKLLKAPTSSSFYNSIRGYNYYSIASLADLASTIGSIGDLSKLKIVQGQTSRGVPGYDWTPDSPVTNVINITNIPEMQLNISTSGSNIIVPGGVKISKLANYLLTAPTASLQAVGSHLRKISGYQVRNWGTIVGGIMMSKSKVYSASTSGLKYFPSDAGLVLSAIGATVNFLVYNSSGVSTSYTNIDLYTFINTSYSGLTVITQINIPIDSTVVFKSYRNAYRVYNAHPNVHMAIRYTLLAGIISNTIAIVGAIGDTATSPYQRFTSLETYMNGKTVASLNASVVIGLINSGLTFTPSIVSAIDQQPYSEMLNYLQQELQGLLVQYILDIQGSPIPIRTDKATSYGTQELWDPNTPNVFTSVTQSQQVVVSLSGPRPINPNVYEVFPYAASVGVSGLTVGPLNGLAQLVQNPPFTTPSSGWNVKTFQYVGTGAGSTGPASLFNSFNFVSDDIIPATTFQPAYISRWLPTSKEKVTGQAKFSADHTSANQLYFEPIINEKTPASISTDTPGAGYIDIDLTAPAFLAAIAAARATYGVKLVLTKNDYPIEYDYVQNAGKKVASPGLPQSQTQGWSSFQALLSLSQGVSGVSSNIFVSNFAPVGTTAATTSGFAPFFASRLRYVNSFIGCVVAIDPILAKDIAKKIADSIVFLTPSNPVATTSRLDAQRTGLAPVDRTFARDSAYLLGFGGAQPYGTVVNGQSDWFNCNLVSPATLVNGVVIPPQPVPKLAPWVSDFNTVWASGTGIRLSGNYVMGATVDSFTMERFSCTIAPASTDDGRSKFYLGGQGPIDVLTLYGLNTDNNSDNIAYFPGETGPNGLYFNPSSYDYVSTNVGGSFGAKIGVGNVVTLENGMLAAHRFLTRQGENNVTIIHNPSHLDALQYEGKSAKLYVSYDLAFNSSGKILAYGFSANADNGFYANSFASTKSANLIVNDAVYNLNASRWRTQFQSTFKPFVAALRSFGTEWIVAGHHTIQQIANYNNTSFFDTMITNLQSEFSPFLGTVAPSAGYIINSLNYQFSGQSFPAENCWGRLLRGIDRKVNQVYNYSTTPNYTGTAYNDTMSNFPAIKQLESEVAVFNANSKYIKRGLAVTAGGYRLPQAFTLNCQIILKQRMNSDYLIEVEHCIADSGSGSKEKLLATLCEVFLLPPEAFIFRQSESLAKSQGFSGVGSAGSLGYAIAGRNAAIDLLNQMIDALYFNQGATTTAAAPTGAQVGFVAASNAGTPYSKRFINSPDELASIKALSPNAYDDTRMLYIVRAGLQDPTYNWPTGATNVDKSLVVQSVWKQSIISIAAGSSNTRGVLNKTAAWFQNYCAFAPFIGKGTAWLTQFYQNGRQQGQNIRDSYTRLGDGINTWFTFSAALSLSEINVLTGEFKEKHAIAAADLGNICDGIANIGQLEGGYNFGKAYNVQERIIYDENTGKVVNNGTWDYKPLCSGNAAERMDCILLNDQTTWYTPLKYINRNGMQWQSKPTSEASTCLGTTYYISLREAIRSYRNANNIEPSRKNTWLDDISGSLTTDKVKNFCPTLIL